jgi:hypothetical protein
MIEEEDNDLTNLISSSCSSSVKSAMELQVAWQVDQTAKIVK